MSFLISAPAVEYLASAERNTTVTGETIVREDLVEQSTWGPSFRNPKVARMVITNRRLLVLPARLPGWQGFCRNLLDYLPVEGGMTMRRYQVPFSSIRRVWKWQPEFSAPVFLQTTDAYGVMYRLLDSGSPRIHPLAIEAQREQVEAVEAAIVEFTKDGREHLS